MRDFWAVGLGGFVGALMRYYLGMAFVRRWSAPLPLATLSVNLLGCFGIGVLLTLAAEARLSDAMHTFLRIGLLGSFTTFSTFSAETTGLVREGQGRLAIAYVALSVLLGLVAVELGRALARTAMGASA